MRDRETMRFTNGGGMLLLVGGPFLAGGLFCLWAFFGGSFMRSGNGEPWVLAIIGGVFTLVGSLLTFGRSGTIVDRRSRTITTWWGLLLPFRSTRHSLDAVTHVHLGRRIRQGKNHSYEVFPVSLAGAETDIDLREQRSHDDSRQFAEQVARFLELGIRDSSGGTVIIREAGTLDESLQQRARRLGLATPQPAQPGGATCTVRYGGPHGTTVIEIPPAGAAPAMFGGVIFVLAFAAIVATQFILPMLSNGLDAMDTPFLVLFGTFFVALPLAGVLIPWLRGARSRTRIEVSPTGVKILASGLASSRATAFTAAEIEEVEAVGLRSGDPDYIREQVLGEASKLNEAQRQRVEKMMPLITRAAALGGRFGLDTGKVVIRSDRASATLGEGLPRAEKEWLRNMIVHVLTADVTGAVATQPAAAATSRQVPRPAAAVTRADASSSTATASTPAPARRGSGGIPAVSVVGLLLLAGLLAWHGLRDKPQRQAAPSSVAISPPATRATPVSGGHPDALAAWIRRAEREHGAGTPGVGVLLYRKGEEFASKGNTGDQELAWLEALRLLRPHRNTGSADVDKEVVARALGDFYWDRRKYRESFDHYRLAHELAEDVVLEDGEYNRRLASSAAGMMATACYLGDWDTADAAMAELKSRIQTVDPAERKRLEYWIRTGEPRLARRKC